MAEDVPTPKPNIFSFLQKQPEVSAADELNSSIENYTEQVSETLDQIEEVTSEEEIKESKTDDNNIIKEKQNLTEKLDEQFLKDSLSYEEYKGKEAPVEYSGSDEQKNVYENLFNTDADFKNFIIENYGTVENYLIQKNLRQESSVYDPTTDYIVDVTIVNEENKVFKSDHISTDQILMELLSGICTFYYVKVDNSAGKTSGTLNNDYIPSDENENRMLMFRPQFSSIRGERIIVWDVNKKKWNSFYMKNLIKFIRDETADIE